MSHRLSRLPSSSLFPHQRHKDSLPARVFPARFRHTAGKDDPATGKDPGDCPAADPGQ